VVVPRRHWEQTPAVQLELAAIVGIWEEKRCVAEGRHLVLVEELMVGLEYGLVFQYLQLMGDLWMFSRAGFV